MKFQIFLLLLLCSHWTFAQSKIYDISLKSLDDQTIKLENYRGNKLLIAVASPDILQSGYLMMLDSIQKLHQSLKIIIIPAYDFGGLRDNEILQSARDVDLNNLIIASGSYVTKSGDKGAQNGLMKFLTDVHLNRHFNDDIDTDFHLFFINETGVLYASLSKGVRMKVLDAILRQPDFID